MSASIILKPHLSNVSLGLCSPEWNWFWERALFTGPLLIDSLSDVFDPISFAELSGYNSPSFDVRPEGLALRLDQAGDALQGLTPPSLRVQPPVTLLMGVQRIGSIPNNATLFGVFYSNTVTNPYISYTFGLNNTGNWALLTNRTTSLRWAAETVSTANSVPIDQTVHLAGIFESGNSRVYIDGVNQSLTRQETFTNVAFDNNSLTTFGDGQYEPNRHPNCRFLYGHILRGKLSEDLIKQFCDDPFGAFRPVDPIPQIFGGTEVGPSAVLPIFSRDAIHQASGRVVR